jgi:hypothetical protein
MNNFYIKKVIRFSFKQPINLRDFSIIYFYPELIVNIWISYNKI